MADGLRELIAWTAQDGGRPGDITEVTAKAPPCPASTPVMRNGSGRLPSDN